VGAYSVADAKTLRSVAESARAFQKMNIDTASIGAAAKAFRSIDPKAFQWAEPEIAKALQAKIVQPRFAGVLADATKLSRGESEIAKAFRALQIDPKLEHSIARAIRLTSAQAPATAAAAAAVRRAVEVSRSEPAVAVAAEAVIELHVDELDEQTRLALRSDYLTAASAIVGLLGYFADSDLLVISAALLALAAVFLSIAAKIPE
jgi:hypothetical protein